jgi:hypothetical protein
MLFSLGFLEIAWLVPLVLEDGVAIQYHFFQPNNMRRLQMTSTVSFGCCSVERCPNKFHWFMAMQNKLNRWISWWICYLGHSKHGVRVLYANICGGKEPVQGSLALDQQQQFSVARRSKNAYRRNKTKLQWEVKTYRASGDVSFLWFSLLSYLLTSSQYVTLD